MPRRPTGSLREDQREREHERWHKTGSFNNDTEGHALRDARRLRELLGDLPT